MPRRRASRAIDRTRTRTRANVSPQTSFALVVYVSLVVIGVIATRVVGVVAHGEREPRLIGWLGEVARPKGRQTRESESESQSQRNGNGIQKATSAWTADEGGGDRRQEGRVAIEGRARVELLSETPRIYLYHAFLSDEECEHVIELGEERLERSTVVGEGDRGMLSQARTSDGTFIARRFTPTLTAVEDRVAEYSGIPWNHQEELQLLRYHDGQEYSAHNDGINSGDNGGKRIATVLMFLREPEWGGETNFPDAVPLPEVKDAFIESKDQFSACGWNEGKGFSVKPRRGDAILFFSFHVNGTADFMSTHASCPTLKGTKYTATKWIHEGEFDTPTWVEPTCENKHEKCDEWASIGECERNPSYMLGVEAVGSCSKSCCDIMDRVELTKTQLKICKPCDALAEGLKNP